jgi:hypothetical protein
LVLFFDEPPRVGFCCAQVDSVALLITERTLSIDAAGPLAFGHLAILHWKPMPTAIYSDVKIPRREGILWYCKTLLKAVWIHREIREIEVISRESNLDQLRIMTRTSLWIVYLNLQLREIELSRDNG